MAWVADPSVLGFPQSPILYCKGSEYCEPRPGTLCFNVRACHQTHLCFPLWHHLVNLHLTLLSPHLRSPQPLFVLFLHSSAKYCLAANTLATSLCFLFSSLQTRNSSC